LRIALSASSPAPRTGLGLSQVHGFIKQSGGHVKIYSEVGEGTTVKIYLPRFTGGETSRSVEQTTIETVVQGTETVLVVEDEDDVREFVATILTERGFRVLTAADADAALQQVRQHASVALLLTDVGLPGSKNGRKLADEARTQALNEGPVHDRLRQKRDSSSRPLRPRRPFACQAIH
jgi:PleD family two-component response regulator